MSHWQLYSRDGRKAIGMETMAILESGQYYLDQVGNVDIEGAVNHSVNNSVHFHFETDLGRQAQSALAQDNRTGDSCSAENPGTKILVTSDSTIEAILKLGDELGETSRIFAMNFASAKNPGGGFLSGSCAQEESIARSSSLIPTLNKFFQDENAYYQINRKNENRGVYTSCSIYSPDVVIFRSAEGLLRAPFRCSFFTIPAPNQRVKNCSASTFAIEILTDRIDRALAVAYLNNHQHLVLGAFGCGVFGNDPGQVASIFKRLINEKYSSAGFLTIVFAIRCFNPGNDINFQAFEEKFVAS